MAHFQGEEIQIWLEGETLGCATNSTLEITADTVDVACKDTGSWSNSKPSKRSWSASSDNFVVFEDIEMLRDALVEGDELTLVYGKVGNFSDQQTTADEDGHVVPTAGWSPESASSASNWTGKCIVTSISISAQQGDTATYSVQFQGVGPLTLVTTSTSTTTGDDD